MHTKTKILIVDDSAVVRTLLGKLFANEDDMEVIGSVSNGNEALSFIKRQSVDFLLLDILMPVMDGITALPLILQKDPRIRVIMVSSLTQKCAESTLLALSKGACDYIPKPSNISALTGVKYVKEELINKIRNIRKKDTCTRENKIDISLKCNNIKMLRRPKVIGIGASTGGPDALSALLGGISKKINIPVLIVQHMPPLFTKVLAERLQNEINIPCNEAKDEELLENGHIYIAPGDYHMRVVNNKQGKKIKLDKSVPLNNCRPSVDPLFESLAECFGDSVLAIVLTGMGEDGKNGAITLAKSNSKIIVQDEETSIVWGMPGAVAKAGIASAILPLNKIAEEIIKLI